MNHLGLTIYVSYYYKLMIHDVDSGFWMTINYKLMYSMYPMKDR